MTEDAVVYVALLGERVEVWRPVAAEHIEGDLYRLTEQTPNDEVWEFSSGEVVRCVFRPLSGDFAEAEDVLVAVRKG